MRIAMLCFKERVEDELMVPTARVKLVHIEVLTTTTLLAGRSCATLRSERRVLSACDPHAASPRYQPWV